MSWNDREDRIAVFEDTISRCHTHECLRAAIRASVEAQQIILEGDDLLSGNENEGSLSGDQSAGLLSGDKNAGSLSGDQSAGLPSGNMISGASPGNGSGKDARIIVSQKRTLEAALGYAGQRVCVLNFASATNPGGGVIEGSSAQEECLCRCSTLYPCINEKSAREGFHYRHRRLLESGEMTALYNDDCIYTPGVVVLKSDTRLPRILPESQWYSVDVITCAAPNLREHPGNFMNPGSDSRAVRIGNLELAALHEKRADRILEIARANHAEVVILGAFGCGAFQNPPQAVAAGIREAVKRHRRDFPVIEFAVYCSPGDTVNYDAFWREFSETL